MQSSIVTNTFKLRDWTIVPMRRKMIREGVEHHLTHKEMQVLLMLVEAKGDVVLNNDLIDQIWKGNYLLGEKGRRQSVWRIRKILKDSKLQPKYIETVHNKGYRLLCPVERGADKPELSQQDPTNWRNRIPKWLDGVLFKSWKPRPATAKM